VVGFGGVPEPAGRVDGVLVAAPDAFPLQVAGGFEAGDDGLGCAFGDADGGGYLTQPGGRFPGDGQQHMGVVGQERPLLEPVSRSGPSCRGHTVTIRTVGAGRFLSETPVGKLPIPVTLGVIIVTIAVSIVWSLRSTRDTTPTTPESAPVAHH
jgi:hypothetical protein